MEIDIHKVWFGTFMSSVLSINYNYYIKPNL